MIKCKLLYVVNDASYFLSHRKELALSALARGYDVHVATPLSSEINNIVALGFIHHLIPLQRQAIGPIAEVRTIYALIHLYKKLQPDLIHHLTIKPILYGSIAAKITKVPAVVNAVTGRGYVFSSHQFKAKLLRPIVRIIYRYALRLKKLMMN